VIRIPPSELSKLQLRMSDYVRVQVMAELRRDGFNRTLSKTLEFERVIPHEGNVAEANLF
jgi:hypothetical protein